MGVIYLPDPNAALQQQMIKDSKDLFEQFRQGGTRDQEKMRALLDQQALASGQQQMGLARTADARAADAAAQSTAANTQAFEANAKKSAQNTASRSVGILPDMSAFEIDPAPADFGSWQGATGPELKQGLEQTPWAELNDAQKGVVGKLPGQHAQLSPLDLGPTWDMNVGVQTGGQKGIATTGTQRAGGETQVTGEPVSELNRKSRTAAGKMENDTATSLLKDFRGEKTVQNYYGAKAAIDTIRRSVASSAKNPSGPADITLLTSFMRSIDPGSTVREGEFATAKNSGGIPEKFVSLYNSLVGKGMLSQAQRQQILAASEENFQSHEATMESIRGQYASHAYKLGISPHYFARESGEAPAAAREGGSSTAAPAASGTPPTEFGSFKDFKAQSANLPPGTQVKFVAKGQNFIGTVEEALSLPESDFAEPPPAAAVAPPSDTYDPTGKGLLPNLKEWWDTPSTDGWLTRTPATESSKQITAEMDAAQKGNGLGDAPMLDALRRAVTGGVAGPASVWSNSPSKHTALPFDKDAHAASLPTRNPALAARKVEDQKQKDAAQKLRQLQSLDLMPVDEGLTSGVTLVNEALTNLLPQQQSDLLSWFQLNPGASASAIRQKVTTLLK